MFPTYREIEQPLVDELRRRGGRARPADKDRNGRTIYDALADHFGLSAEARAATIYEKGVHRSKWENMVRYARRRLKDDGVVETPSHGVWELRSK
jgi:restriction endonuclease Mrr